MVISPAGKKTSHVCSITSADRAGSFTPTITLTGVLVSGLAWSEKSDLAQACRYAANASTVEFSSECRTTWSMKVAVSLLPVVKSMIAARLPGLPGAPENSAQPLLVHGHRAGRHRVEADQL